MGREALRAYLKAQAAHKAIHKLTKAFEEDLPDSVVLERIALVEELLQQVRDDVLITSLSSLRSFN